MRLFVGLDIDDDIRERITEFVSTLKVRVPDVRFVGPETYHITLKFIGETAKFDEIREALERARVAPFNISFGGLGFFPNHRAPRVFWAGIHADEELAQLSKSVNAVLEPVGFAADAGPYRPHLTLARSGSGSPRPKPGERSSPRLQRVAEIIASVQPQFGTMTAREYFLYESKLSPRGAQYLRRERYALE